jgi:predicted GNAT superfamily acetyltransferase
VTLTTMQKGTGVIVRSCSTPEEFRRCAEIEEAVWHFSGSDAVSHHILAVAHEIGGQVFGAFEDARMIGFALAFPAIRDGHVHLHSHMAAVLPEYQDRGIGRKLKLAQREEALARGIKRIEWTFDPLQLRNANFNINRLGAIVRRYIPNFYGESSSPLHANLPTDRLVAEWHLDSERVRLRADGAVPESSEHAGAVTIAVPSNMNELRNGDPAQAVAVQAEIREQFLEKFGDGWAVTGVSKTETGGKYYLEKWNAN